ncbi:hypothetical protein GRO01_16340 [Gluconobacter roseus NBRC 3990]|uniref:Uncharacterized protein n=1 Tax=Gluconobacter roseus NBRC 3990 TaxID=1307950 RepID=A0A4Y3M9B2_9PROT|nr:hypothetical protein GRO01_16340 [Gluconobacter roseus NBRC 3990]GLP92503.1 hypothetical protein GCM10007871_04810 [Gluconobacter roseus NBRC 3990]
MPWLICGDGSEVGKARQLEMDQQDECDEHYMHDNQRFCANDRDVSGGIGCLHGRILTGLWLDSQS